MPKILELEPHVADLIAAGEVVERPASAVKELIENSIDAQASALTVEIQNGGMSYIRVSDNGCGIAPEDTQTAFLRHATSKLRDERGLEAIGTLGFRGEALAAIASVSRIELLTRESGAAEGTALSLEGGNVTEKNIAGCAEGTTIVVKNLFFNTPARLKYMKKDSAEAAAVSAAVIRCALSHPEVSIKYIKDGVQVLHTPGDGRIDSCIYSIFGSDFSKGLLSVAYEDEEVCVRGTVTPPSASRGNRGWQYFFINGRFVSSKLLQAALEQAYKNSLFTGRFPACVLYLTMKPSLVDVNVHPAKTQVRFLSEKRVFDSVYYAVLTALSKENAAPEIKIDTDKNEKKPENGENSESKEKLILQAEERTVSQVKESDFESEYKKPYSGERNFKHVSATSSSKLPLASPRGFRYDHSPLVQIEHAHTPMAIANNKAQQKVQHEQQSIEEMPRKESFRVIGEALKTYIIVEKGNEILLIDKHAAHERVIFDKLKSESTTPMQQQLLAPVVVQLPHEQVAVLAENSELFESMGLELNEFGADSIAVRALPADMYTGDIEPMLCELAEKLLCGNTVDDVRDELLHSVACKAAIKAGSESVYEELYVIAEKVVSGAVRYCPHGRPVAMELTKSMLDKGFKRI